MANMYINAMTALWNTGGTTYSAIKMTVTDSGSAAASLLLHLKTGALDMFTVKKNGNVYAAGDIQAAAAGTTATSVATLDATQTLQNKTVVGGSSKWFKGMIHGLTLSNNVTDATNDIDIAIGTAASNDTTPALMDLTSALIKRLDAVWAVGTNQGMLATGVAIANTTYHIFLIRRSDTGVVDVAADTSVTGANIAANTNVAYTQKRRIGSIVRTAAAIKGFVQNGNSFDWKVPVGDIAANNPGAAAVTALLTVPTGVAMRAVIAGSLLDTTSAGVSSAFLITSLAQTDTVPTSLLCSGTEIATTGDAVAGNFYTQVMTNTSSQIRYRLENSSVDHTMVIVTHGWIDTRGRDS